MQVSCFIGHSCAPHCNHNWEKCLHSWKFYSFERFTCFQQSTSSVCFSNFIHQAALASLNQAGFLFILNISCCNSRTYHLVPQWYYTAGSKHQPGYLLTISSFGIGLFHLNQTLYKVICYSIISVPRADRTPAFPYVIENKSQLIAQIINSCPPLDIFY